MNYKISLAALAVAATVSGQAIAATGDAMNAVNALRALGVPTPSGYTGLDGDVTNVGVWTSDATDDANACTFAGVLCDGSNEMTKFEMPNAAWAPTGGMPAVLTALDTVKDTLLTLNLSNTVGPNNDMSSGMTGLDGFTALQKLAINNSSADGVVPDMSGSTLLNWVNYADNPGITGLDGKLAGGSNITFLVTNNNNDMAGDLGPTLASVSTSSSANVTVDDTKLYGEYTFKAGDTASVANSDIIVANDPGTVGYSAAAVVQPAAGATVTGGEEAATVSWTQPVAGAETGYNVSYTADNGVTLLGTTAVTGLTHSFSNVTAGTYKAVVQSTGPNSRMAASVMSADFVVTEAVTPPATQTCEDGSVIPATDTCPDPADPEEPVSSGGGGAALWLAMLPLMGLFRRKRA